MALRASPPPHLQTHPFHSILHHDSVNPAALLCPCPFCSGHFNLFKKLFFSTMDLDSDYLLVHM